MGLEQIAIAFGLSVLRALIDAGKLRRDQTLADALGVLGEAEADRDAARADWQRTLPPNQPKNE
jgi:hypothetical protein